MWHDAPRTVLRQRLVQSRELFGCEGAYRGPLDFINPLEEQLCRLFGHIVNSSMKELFDAHARIVADASWSRIATSAQTFYLRHNRLAGMKVRFRTCPTRP